MTASDPHVNGDVTVLLARGFDGCNLHAGWQDGLHGFHGESPGEGLFVEDLVEGLGLSQQLRVGGLMHEVFGVLALGLDARNLHVDGMLSGACFSGAAIEEMKPEAKED